MKALLVLLLVVLAAAAAYAYGHTDEAVRLATVAEQTSRTIGGEPVTLCLSGALLIGIAGAVRRCSF